MLCKATAVQGNPRRADLSQQDGSEVRSRGAGIDLLQATATTTTTFLLLQLLGILADLLAYSRVGSHIAMFKRRTHYSHLHLSKWLLGRSQICRAGDHAAVICLREAPGCGKRCASQTESNEGIVYRAVSS